MHTVFNSLIVLILLATAYLAATFFIETNRFDDTVVYEATQEDRMITPIVPSAPATTTSTTSIEVPMETVEKLIEEAVINEETVPAPSPNVKKRIVVEEIVDETPPPQSMITEEESGLSFSEINDMTRQALVNIFCLTQGPHQYINPISGSGVIINESGVILTNAHIAQLWLFEDFPKEGFVDCQIRTGSPAKPAYRAQLLFISPQWVRDNSDAISTENPMGTGEDDYAFLLITETINGSSLPEKFPHINYDSGDQIVTRGESLLVGAYPAGFLGGRTIQQDLYASTAIVDVTELYTFEDVSNLDLISLGGSVVAQQGASGGPVVNKFGKAVALISTSSDGETTDERDLRAITLEHIERSMLENNNTDIDTLLNGNLKVKADAFTQTSAPPLLQILLNSF